jgi:uncharacterized protein (DUF2252 family)
VRLSADPHPLGTVILGVQALRQPSARARLPCWSRAIDRLAALTGQRVSVAKDRSGAVEALRALRTTRKTAVCCRRAILQQLHNAIVAAPEKLRDQVRNLTRMQRLRTCAGWRPDTIAYRDPVVATKIALRSLDR